MRSDVLSAKASGWVPNAASVASRPPNTAQQDREEIEAVLGMFSWPNRPTAQVGALLVVLADDLWSQHRPTTRSVGWLLARDGPTDAAYRTATTPL